MSFHEHALSIPCAGESLVGILARPEGPVRDGVVIVVGGPQVRTGSHRQFTALARALAAGGAAVLRFDVRGMGDSGGAQRDFESIDDDIRAAVDALCREVPELGGVTLWGLCDGASAALLYVGETRDTRVRGLALLNPWVRTEASAARTQVRHYYLQRLMQADFWRKLLRGGVGVSAVAGLWSSVRRLGASSAPETTEGGAAAAARDPGGYRRRMAAAWRSFDGPILLALSGRDFTAREFEDALTGDPDWSGAAAQAGVHRIDLPGSDHTVSDAAGAQRLAEATLDWLAAHRAAPASPPTPAAPPPARTPAPRQPMLAWRSFLPGRTTAEPGIFSLPSRLWTTSGRAGLTEALARLGLSPGDAVWVPTFHCPTLIAPVVHLGLVPRYYALGDDGLPRLSSLKAGPGPAPRALVVSHLFDRARSLASVRAWCDAHGVSLVEDCAHAPVGMAGERPAGHWGDLATASVTKFAPVPEMGLLASSRPLRTGRALGRPSVRDQVKDVWDVFDLAAPHGRPALIHAVVSGIAGRRRASVVEVPAAGRPATAPSVGMADCDMGRVGRAPTWMAHALRHGAWSAGAAAARRANHRALYAALEGATGLHTMFGPCPDDSAPYALPVWVDRADETYHALRRAGHAVFRWDRVWPGTAEIDGDHAPAWRRHVLQCLCHDALTPAQMQSLGTALRRLAADVDAAPRSAAAATPATAPSAATVAGPHAGALR